METITSEIVSQHSVKLGNNTLPMLYIKHDPRLIPLIGHKVTSTIQGDDKYSGTFVSSIFSSGNFPSVRPNFFMKYKYLVVLLHVPWEGYSSKVGNITISFDPSTIVTSKTQSDLPKFIYDTPVDFGEGTEQKFIKADDILFKEDSNMDEKRLYTYTSILIILIILVSTGIYNQYQQQ